MENLIIIGLGLLSLVIIGSRIKRIFNNNGKSCCSDCSNCQLGREPGLLKSSEGNCSDKMPY